jgi:NodT family efflux transporter outer membrane factor (OMF) lipoprotein
MSIIGEAPAKLGRKTGLRIGSFALLILPGAVAMSMSGCTFGGPKYVKPQMTAPAAYKEAVASSDWKTANPQDALQRGKWWEIFHESELNQLEEQLNIDNQNIAKSFQNFVAARDQVAQARASYWPTVTVGLSATRNRQPPQGTTFKGVTQTASTINSFRLPVSISWEPDLFGKIRNQVKQSSAAAQISAADLENERLSEQASLAQYYFQLRGQDAVIALYRKTIANYEKTLELTTARHETGIVSDEDVAGAESNLKAAQASATALTAIRAQYEHAIALLIGKPAGEFSLPERALTIEAPAIPVGLPSQLLERRPDIAAAERTVAEYNAVLGLGHSAYFPTLSISSGFGTQSTTWSNLYNASNTYWSVGPSLSETIFDGGQRKAQYAQYKAQYKANVANYRETVLNAMKEVEDYLITVRTDGTQIRQQDDAIASAQRYYDIANTRYETGLDTYLNVLTAQNTLLNDQQSAITLRVNRIVSSVQLIQALGGGWDASQLPTDLQLKQGYKSTENGTSTTGQTAAVPVQPVAGAAKN